MKILLLHQYFKTPESGGAIRSYYLIKALVEAKHHVVVITTHNEKEYRIVNIEGAEVHYLPVPYNNHFNFLQRVNAFTRYVFRAASVSRKFRDFDISYVISVPLTIGIVARLNQIRFGINYIFEVGDLWPDAPIQIGYIKNFFIRKMLLGLEKSLYHHAKSVVALSPSIGEAIKNKIPGKKIHVIPNMADMDFYFPEQKDPALVNKFGIGEKVVITCAGAMGVANGLEYVLECANVSRKHNLPVHFILCGDGAMRDQLIKSADLLGLQNLSILPFTKRDGVREIMNVTDAVFISYKNVPILETGSPNKFFDGLAGGKMIINNFGGWIRKEIEESQCGISIDPNNPEDFILKIKPFLSDREKLRESQKAARALAEAKYSREMLSEQFVRLF